MGPLPFAGCGTPVATSLGTNHNTTGATLTLTPVTVPAGSLIVVAVWEFPSASNSTPGTVSDGVNTYSLATSVLVGSSSRGPLALFYAPNASLSSGTITYTKQASTAAGYAASGVLRNEHCHDVAA